MTFALSILAALLMAHFVPGLAFVRALGLGRDRPERWILAAVCGAPLAAAFYWMALWIGWSPIYWCFIAASVMGMVGAVAFRNSPAASKPWSRSSGLVVGAAVVALLAAYLATTGSSYRPDDQENLLMDRALQRDVLFHLAVIRSLESSYPPTLLSSGALPIGYHVGYHLQLAAWARYFGIDAVDGLVRVATPYYLTLFVLTAFLLARRFTDSEFTAVLTSVLVVGGGFGFFFWTRPSVDWWSLVFTDVTLVSVFLANPLLPALPLFFVALMLLSDYLDSGKWGVLAGSVLCGSFVLVVKMFLGAQFLAGLGLAMLVDWRGRPERRFRVAAFWHVLACLPLLGHTFLAAEGSNTAVGMRPLEIVRYAMEKISWDQAAERLGELGALSLPTGGWWTVLLATLLWAFGFLGLRLIGVYDCASDLTSPNGLRRTMAWCVAVGLPVALLVRIAPAESEGLSRLEAQNDVVWFAAQSGVLLWFWTAAALGRFRYRGVALACVLFLVLPATIQHFVHAGALEPDRVSPDRWQAALQAKSLSSSSDVWLERPDRVHPSLVAYLAGRPVVHDAYVGYDYMFVGREALDYRRHAVAQFWTSSDENFTRWVLRRFQVRYVWSGDGAPLPAAARWLEPVFENDAVRLYRVRDEAHAAGALELETPRRIPLGGRGLVYVGRGFSPPGSQVGRSLLPSERAPARIYFPSTQGRSTTVRLELLPGVSKGELVVGERRVPVEERAEQIQVLLPAWKETGLQTLELLWNGAEPLALRGIELMR